MQAILFFTPSAVHTYHSPASPHKPLAFFCQKTSSRTLMQQISPRRPTACLDSSVKSSITPLPSVSAMLTLHWSNQFWSMVQLSGTPQDGISWMEKIQRQVVRFITTILGSIIKFLHGSNQNVPSAGKSTTSVTGAVLQGG